MTAASFRTLLRGAAVITVLALTVGAALAKPDGTSKMPTKRDSDYEAGKRLWTQSCWQCHGEDGKGNGPAAAALPGGVPTLEGKVAEPEFDRLIEIIQGGQGRMPAYGENIDARDSKRILAYIRSRLEGEPPPPPEEGAKAKKAEPKKPKGKVTPEAKASETPDAKASETPKASEPPGTSEKSEPPEAPGTMSEGQPNGGEGQ